MIYLDHAATSFPKPERIFCEMVAFARECGANPGRGAHRRSLEAQAMIEDTRRLLARLLDFPRPERIVFTLNATDALNMAIKGVLQPGAHVITSDLEHNSVSRPLNRLAEEGLITLTRLKAGADHRLDPEEVARAFTPATRLVALTHVSTVTGTIQPIGELGRLVRERGALFLVDAAQSVGLVPIDMQAEAIDLLAFAGHKSLLGPTGTGGLAVGERVSILPWREGGTGGDSSSPLHPSAFPEHLEGGTPNTLGIAGLRAGLRLLAEEGLDERLPRERELLVRFYGAFRDPERFQWYGAEQALSGSRWEGRVGLVELNLPGFEPSELAAVLDERFDIAVRPGLHCAPYAHRHLGTFPQGTVRLSVGFQTTGEQMEAAAAALEQIAAL